MINSIINGISTALNTEFGDGYENYTNEIKQDLVTPCFFIQCLNPTIELFLGKRYFRRNQFCIQYFPATADKLTECNSVAERMMWSLECITVQGDKYRSSKVSYEVVDGVLNFFLNYDCFVYKVEVEDEMETVTIDESAT